MILAALNTKTLYSKAFLEGAGGMRHAASSKSSWASTSRVLSYIPLMRIKRAGLGGSKSADVDGNSIFDVVW